MHKTIAEAESFVQKIAAFLKKASATAGLAVPFTMLSAAKKAAKGSSLLIGAQNICEEKKGAFTGEISAEMVVDAGAQFTLIGHSERRHVYKESDKKIHEKLLRAFEKDLLPILCVGETKEQHQAHETHKVLGRQIQSALENIPENHLKKIIIAYEPVWAIGTGLAATPDIIQQSHQECLRVLKEDFHVSLPILYGGSVKPENAKEIFQIEEVFGVLVGGASLEIEDFVSIVETSTEK